jgi:hypothetical protein
MQEIYCLVVFENKSWLFIHTKCCNNSLFDSDYLEIKHKLIINISLNFTKLFTKRLKN